MERESHGGARDAIVFVPGFDAKEKDYYIDRYLALGLANRLEDRRAYMEPEPVKIAGLSGRRFTFESQGGAKKTVDIYEIYWRDLVEDLNEGTIRYRVFRGIYLLLYWLSASFKIGRMSGIFLLQVTAILGLIAAWEYGTVIMAMTAIGTDPNALGFQLPSQWAEALGRWGQALGGWQLWLVTSALLSFLPISINVLIHLLDFIVRYAEDDTVGGVATLRDRLRHRLTGALADVFDSGDYGRVTVMAHSLGSVLAVDCLADYRFRPGEAVRFVTLGTPLKMMAAISTWIRAEVEKCLHRDAIAEWVDFYSDRDWLCTRVPLHRGVRSDRFRAEAISLRVSLAQQLTAESHRAYFFDRAVLETLLD
ncbi:hypothetical protein [Lyngbya sp. CCY1209]|uniref:hypothetical protein n=1 Tax=Lyngbya sp. CCY1209 TaxID=2886103 RepID=UPI002D20C36D|nr:hypothetical protein [Lyngbya sp. CCY1209]MEB3884043.1 hypothetical protein [Lyngbya sp. CCY1209]